MRRLLTAGLALALASIVAGVAVIYWPAALIVFGVGLAAVCLLADDGKTRGGANE